MTYPMSVGRNFAEILRALDAVRKTDGVPLATLEQLGARPGRDRGAGTGRRGGRGEIRRAGQEAALSALCQGSAVGSRGAPAGALSRPEAEPVSCRMQPHEAAFHDRFHDHHPVHDPATVSPAAADAAQPIGANSCRRGKSPSIYPNAIAAFPIGTAACPRCRRASPSAAARRIWDRRPRFSRRPATMPAKPWTSCFATTTSFMILTGTPG